MVFIANAVPKFCFLVRDEDSFPPRDRAISLRAYPQAPAKDDPVFLMKSRPHAWRAFGELGIAVGERKL